MIAAGSNGMGQAQSQSAGTGCEDCYGGDGHYEESGAAGPDPLRSSTGARNGAPQQQVVAGGVHGGRSTGSIERGDQPPFGYTNGRITDFTPTGGRPILPGQTLGIGECTNSGWSDEALY